MSDKSDLINTSIDKICFQINYHKEKLSNIAYSLMVYIKNIIGSFTDLVYYSSKIIVYSDSVEFTIKIEEHNDRLDKLSLINKRIESIKNYIKNNKITDKKVLSCIRTFLVNGYNPDEILSIYYYIDKELFREYIPINFDKIPDIKINSEEYKNIGVKHIHIYNPFIDDTACELYFEESKPLKDFIGYGPNYLHYYEHIVGSFLDQGTYEGLFKYEAFTTITGVCLCSIIEKEEVCKIKLKEYIEGRNNMSEGKFDLESIKLQKERIISETQNLRSFSDCFKISGEVYKNNTFNLNILQYYASLNYTIISISNHTYENNPFTKIISELNNKLKINRVNPPEVVKYKHLLHDRLGPSNKGFRLYYKDLPKKFKSKYRYTAGPDSVFVHLDDEKHSNPLNIITALSIVPKSKYEYIAKYKFKYIELKYILANTYDIF